MADINEAPVIFARVVLANGLIGVVQQSRKSAAGKDGQHLIACILNGDKELTFKEVAPEDEMVMLTTLRKVAGNISPVFRVEQNSPELASRENWHAHVKVVITSKDELQARGLEILRSVDPRSLIGPIPPPKPDPAAKPEAPMGTAGTKP